MNLEDVLNYRRSVRVYDKAKKVDTRKVKHGLELATLAPNSSNMQLWEFYHITEPDTLSKLSKACLGQTAVSTASEAVVFVTRQDLYKNAQNLFSNLNRETSNAILLKSDRRNVLRTGNYIMVG